MTTAHDLPAPDAPPGRGLLPASGAPIPAQTRPALAVVPDQPADDVVEFEDVLRRAAPRLQAYAVRRLHDPHEAEEIVQEALLRAFQHRDRLATEDDLMAWVTVVTGRLVIDRLRVRGRSTPVAEIGPAAKTGRDTADLVVAREEARIALDALEALPGRQASVLWAREIEGLSYDAIGERFAISEPTVRSVLHRARKSLRREYSLRGGTMPAVGLAALAPWLSPLRTAGRVRALARRGATAATVAAGGLAVVTVAPFGAGGSRVHQAPASTPAIGITAVDHLTAAHRGRQPAIAAAAHQAPAPAAAPPKAGVAAPTSRIMPLAPHVCGGRYAVGCRTHTGHVLFVKLPAPVDGKRWIGISTDTVDCAPLPTTPVVQCDHHEGATR
jgi:RNA polymerase sigma-70 factor, ECF subfamily